MEKMMMKHSTRMGRSILRSALVAGLLTFALWTEGQAQAAESLTFGLKAGVNAGSFLNEDSDESGRRYGLTAGGFMDFPLASAIDLRMELLYTQKGLTGGANTVALDYIEVPVLGKFGFGSGGVMPFLYAGPSIGYNVSAKLKSDSDSLDYGDLVKSFEGSLAFGGGLGFAAGARTIELDVRYTMGLTSVFDFGDPSDSDSDDKNQGFSATLGIIL